MDLVKVAHCSLHTLESMDELGRSSTLQSAHAGVNGWTWLVAHCSLHTLESMDGLGQSSTLQSVHAGVNGWNWSK